MVVIGSGWLGPSKRAFCPPNLKLKWGKKKRRSEADPSNAQCLPVQYGGGTDVSQQQAEAANAVSG